MFSKIISTVVVLELLLLLLDMKSHSSGLAAEGTSRNSREGYVRVAFEVVLQPLLEVMGSSLPIQAPPTTSGGW